MIATMRRIAIVDTHTEGEPTRVVVGGGPELAPGSAGWRLATLRHQHDGFRTAVVGEPRGSSALVGALLTSPQSADAVAQVIFFNNDGYLGMCVHGTIGVARALAHLGRIGAGRHRLETPAGAVHFTVGPDAAVAVENVLSYRHRAGVRVATERHGEVSGDVAYGGNWFFAVDGPVEEIALRKADALMDFARDVRRSLRRAGITGKAGAEIDHVELFAPPSRADVDSKNFVLCPGKAYDRSPCGTGTSAKMACLAADGRLEDGRVWRQEGILGGLFEGTVRRTAGGVMPTVAGRAFVTAEATLLIESRDPYPQGWAA